MQCYVCATLYTNMLTHDGGSTAKLWQGTYQPMLITLCVTKAVFGVQPCNLRVGYNEPGDVPYVAQTDITFSLDTNGENTPTDLSGLLAAGIVVMVSKPQRLGQRIQRSWFDSGSGPQHLQQRALHNSLRDACHYDC
jgi:hypothetical protein